MIGLEELIDKLKYYVNKNDLRLVLKTYVWMLLEHKSEKIKELEDVEVEYINTLISSSIKLLKEDTYYLDDKEFAATNILLNFLLNYKTEPEIKKLINHYYFKEVFHVKDSEIYSKTKELIIHYNNLSNLVRIKKTYIINHDGIDYNEKLITGPIKENRYKKTSYKNLIGTKYLNIDVENYKENASNTLYLMSISEFNNKILIDYYIKKLKKEIKSNEKKIEPLKSELNFALKNILLAVMLYRKEELDRFLKNIDKFFKDGIEKKLMELEHEDNDINKVKKLKILAMHKIYNEKDEESKEFIREIFKELDI